MPRILTLLIVLIASTLLCSGVVAAQTTTATLSGSVTDQNDAVIPDVKISVISFSQGFQRSATTNSEGVFVIPLLPPGTYAVKAERAGFTTTEVRNVVLNVNDQLAIKIPMNVGSVIQNVEVELSSAINESATVATVVDRQFAENLPLNGRSLQALISLTAGAVITKSTFGDQGQFSVNGQRTNSNYFSIDGASANIGISLGTTITQTAGGSIPGFSAAGGTNNLISIDAMQEFKVMTSNFAPEFGRTPGAQVQIASRAGTNQFRGTLFEYFRNDALDANDWFANRSGFAKPPLRQNDFGFVLGGPLTFPRFGEGGSSLKKLKKTFFFLSYEGLRLRQPQFRTTLVPNLNARQNAAPSIRPFLNAYPLPNGPNRPNGFADFSASYSNPTNLDATSIRVDHTINNRLNFFGRYNHSPSSVLERGSAGAALNQLAPQTIKTQTLTVGATLLLTSTLINEIRGNYSQNKGSFKLSVDGLGGGTPLPAQAFPPNPYSLEEALLVFNILGGSNSALIVGTNANHLQRQFNITNNLLLLLPQHQLKFGVDFRQLSPQIRPRKYQQSALFLGVTSPDGSFGPGTAASGQAAIGRVVASEPNSLSIKNFSAFAQDTWHQSSRLTLTFGLRWDVNPAPTGITPLLTLDGLDSTAPIAVAPTGTPLYETTYNNFAPRLGGSIVLSDATGREMIVRGGIGVFYDLGTGTLGNAAFSFPYTRTRSLPANTPFPFSPADAATLPFNFTQTFASDVNVADRKLKLPCTYQWNASLEQSLGPIQSATLSYIGAIGHRLLRQETLFNPNPKFAVINLTRNSGNSDYHALQMQLKRRLSRRLQALVSYTWSNSTDNGSSDSNTIPPSEKLGPDTERGPSDFDVRHSLSAAITYNLPKPNLGSLGRALLRDWSLDSVTTAHSATPWSPGVFRDIGFGGFTFRPDRIQGVPLYVDDPLVAGGRKANSAAFAVPTTLRQGSLGRNALRGFPAWQIDMALRRQIQLTEKTNILIRAEAFNIFNHPNFGDPGAGFTGGSSVTGASFGQSQIMLGRSLGTGAGNGGFNPLYQFGGPRSIQLALKLSF
jgi:hypothetical protein